MGDYRQLRVWQRAHGVALTIYGFTETFPLRERYGLAAQMRRAAVSVMSNIAEGCGRQGDRELGRFLRIARGSIQELECHLILSRDLGYLRQEAFTDLEQRTKEISRILHWIIRRNKTPIKSVLDKQLATRDF